MAAATLSELKLAVHQAIELLGFRYFVYGGCLPLPRIGAHELSFDNCPPLWPGNRTGFAPLRYALLEGMPVAWRQLHRHDPAWFAEAHTWGLRSGMTYPVRSTGGPWSLLSLVRDDEGPEAERKMRLVLARGHALANAVHESVEYIVWVRLGPLLCPDPVPLEFNLTIRERDCLALAAAGKTAGDIARAMSISQRTVFFHLSNARKKLGAHNSRHAIMKALSLKLLKTD